VQQRVKADAIEAGGSHSMLSVTAAGTIAAFETNGQRIFHDKPADIPVSGPFIRLIGQQVCTLRSHAVSKRRKELSLRC
jgi:hypothetical protein